MAKRQIVHPPRNRKVVNDLGAVDVQAPSASGGASLPNLRTRPTNRMMQSLAGFSETLAQLAVRREKNDAAKEALAARNTALAGKFASFKRQASVDIYDQTRGDIAGRKSRAQLREQLDQGIVDILNGNDDLPTSLQKYDEFKSQLTETEYSNDLQESENYKAGFLPHYVEQVEAGRLELGARFKAKFDAQTDAVLSEKVDQVASEVNQFQVFDPNAPDSGGRLAQKSGLGMEEFNGLVKTGVDLGKSREDSIMHILTTIAAKADEEGRPDLFNFAKETTVDGIKLESNQKYNKIIDAGRDAATKTLIAAGKERDRQEKLELKTGQDRSQNMFYTYVFDNGGDPKSKKLINSLAKRYQWTPDQITKALAYVDTIGSGVTVTPDSNVEWKLSQDIQEGTFKTEAQLADMILLSSQVGEGVDKGMGDRLRKRMAERRELSDDASAYKRHLDGLKAFLGRGKGLVLDTGTEDFVTQTQKAGKVVEEFKEALSAFYIEFGQDALMDSPEANKYFQEARDRVMLANGFGPPTEAPTGEPIDIDAPGAGGVLEARRKQLNAARVARQEKQQALTEVGATHNFLLNR
jgi:hypothetical protein